MTADTLTRRLRPLLLLGFLAVLLSSSAASAQTPVRNPANGHYYLLVVLPTPITWQDANNAARNTSFRGMPGYLATATSAQENNFLRNHVYKNSARPPHYSLWLGGFKLPSSTKPKNGWRWVTGEPWNFTYWAYGEPTNGGDGEDKLIADGPRSCTWNDLRDSASGEAGHVDILAYVVEYGKVVLPAPHKRRIH